MMTALPPWLPLSIALAIALTALALAADRALSRARRRRVARRRQLRAEAGERDAERLLRREGYRIEAAQAELDWAIELDGEPLEVPLRADLLVRRKGRRYIAEVKTGRTAPSLRRCAATRRQLLEYRVAYDVDGVLLIDMEQGCIQQVHFPGIDATPLRSPVRVLWFAMGLGSGAALTVLLLARLV